MTSNSTSNSFLTEAKSVVLDNISNEQFGVSELADEMSMSRSSLLRKIKKQTNLSASQFMREIRLQEAARMLQETELTVSEISFEVGFSNPSYFTKCFREHYGFSPGESRKKIDEHPETEVENTQSKSFIENNNDISFFKKYQFQIFVAIFFTIAGSFLLFQNISSNSELEVNEIKKSIAVLPFKNMSTDSTNLYFVNGLMESALNNLQKIKDLRVISRTSVEKYRNTNKTIKEIAEELNVAYLLEGSGQRIDDQVLLNIQLIDAINDMPIWAQQYNNKVVDVFALQNTVANKIVDAIQAKVTPAEFQQINKKPTKNLEAYDFYLKGLTPLQKQTKEGLNEAITMFENAIELDSSFALAYSQLAIAHYYLDQNQSKKQYTEIINNYADKALLYDSKSAESLIAKALYYINIKEFQLAIPHLEKALEYNPNSSPIVQILAELYSKAIPNTGKYLKYALMGLQLDIDANDSITKSYVYLAVSNAFIQNGFTEDALKYINLSLDSNPENYYAPYLKVFILYALHQNMEKATEALIKEWKKDTTRLDIMQDVGKFYYFQEKYDSAFYYYDKFEKIKENNGLSMYPQENLKIGLVFDKMGLQDKAKNKFKAYAEYCKNDKSIYQPASLAMKYLYEGNPNLAMEQFQIFATKNNYQYWILLFFEKDPLMKSLKNHPDYDAVVQKIRDRFWENHEQLKKSLKNKNLL